MDPEADTLPPHEYDADTAIMTPAAFRKLLQEMVGTPLVALHADVRAIRNDVASLERRVSALENLRQHYPMAISLVALLGAIAALVR